MHFSIYFNSGQIEKNMRQIEKLLFRACSTFASDFVDESKFIFNN